MTQKTTGGEGVTFGVSIVNGMIIDYFKVDDGVKIKAENYYKFLGNSFNFCKSDYYSPCQKRF